MVKWDKELWLFTPKEFNMLPDGFKLVSIRGNVAIKGVDDIDMDERFEYLAYGVQGPLESHPEAELLTKIKLST